MDQETLDNIDLDIYNLTKDLNSNDEHTMIYMRACFKKGLNKSIVITKGDSENAIRMIADYMDQDVELAFLLTNGVVNYFNEHMENLDKLIEDLQALKKQ